MSGNESLGVPFQGADPHFLDAVGFLFLFQIRSFRAPGSGAQNKNGQHGRPNIAEPCWKPIGSHDGKHGEGSRNDTVSEGRSAGGGGQWHSGSSFTAKQGMGGPAAARESPSSRGDMTAALLAGVTDDPAASCPENREGIEKKDLFSMPESILAPRGPAGGLACGDRQIPLLYRNCLRDVQVGLFSSNPLLVLVRRRRLEPSADTMYNLNSPVRLEANTIWRPSGDHSACSE